MIKISGNLLLFFRFLAKHLRILIFLILSIIYFLAFKFVRYQKKSTELNVSTENDYEILKLVDIVEYSPPPAQKPKPEPIIKKPEPKEKIIQTEKQPVAAENIIEVEEEVEEIEEETVLESEEITENDSESVSENADNSAHNVGTMNLTDDFENYFPQHKITKVPRLPEKEILSKIVYPAMAQRQGIKGVVYLELYIDAEGNIRKIVVLKDPGHGFAEAAIAALEGIKCEPAQANGENVPVRFRYPIRFKLN